MVEDNLNPDAHAENIRALMKAAGISEGEASARLEQTILMTWDSADDGAVRLAAEIQPILSRTIRVTTVPDGVIAAELVLGAAMPRTGGNTLFAVIVSDVLRISRTPPGVPCSVTHRLLTLISACYTVSGILNLAIGEGLTNRPPFELEIAFGDILPSGINLDQPVLIDECYLAGAGAIGNGFLWAAKGIDLRGIMYVADDDTVSSGNLQRQIWFGEADIGEGKAEILCAKAQRHFPNCELKPARGRLQDHENRTEGPWLKRLIVGVDSRRARREIQKELPGEVFDASTTGSREIVLHYNKQPTDLACLGCIYYQNEVEIRHEDAVAWHLGIPVDRMAMERIDEDTAKMICALHEDLRPEMLINVSFHTLYKQLCSAEQLRSVGGDNVIAPFAFVSVLAGAFLLINLINRVQGGMIEFNDWRISPWRAPVLEARQRIKKRKHCECCGREEIAAINRKLWAA